MQTFFDLKAILQYIPYIITILLLTQDRMACESELLYLYLFPLEESPKITYYAIKPVKILKSNKKC